MADEKKKGEGDVNQNQLGQMDDAAGAADQQKAGDVSDAAGQEQLSEKEKGLLAKATAETKKRQEAETQLEQERAYYQQAMNIQQANQQKPPPQQQQDYFAQKGLTNDDFLKVADIKDYVQELQTQNQVLQTRVEVNDFIAQHPDFAETIGQMNQFTGQFVYAKPLLNAMKEDPLLRKHLNDPIAAYKLVKTHQEKVALEAQIAANQEKEAQQTAETKTAPMSSTAVGGAGATNLASQIGDLSDPAQYAKFKKLDRDVMSGKHG